MSRPATQTVSLGVRLKKFIDSPTGPKTTHFWGPVANWGFVVAVSGSHVAWLRTLRSLGPAGPSCWQTSRPTLPRTPATLQGLADTSKPPEMISGKMTAGVCVLAWEG